ncbi:hypothetical protein [Metabacillus schmidteae]|uniref:hypothetical protein n=1 Tax=Metabacillus schmidteae TaxID=2730405 RepID=UPI00158A2EFD|nr:hypothetical protein [Metabacillus schmidteae]
MKVTIKLRDLYKNYNNYTVGQKLLVYKDIYDFRTNTIDLQNYHISRAIRLNNTHPSEELEIVYKLITKIQMKDAFIRDELHKSLKKTIRRAPKNGLKSRNIIEEYQFIEKYISRLSSNNSKFKEINIDPNVYNKLRSMPFNEQIHNLRFMHIIIVRHILSDIGERIEDSYKIYGEYSHRSNFRKAILFVSNFYYLHHNKNIGRTLSNTFLKKLDGVKLTNYEEICFSYYNYVAVAESKFGTIFSPESPNGRNSKLQEEYKQKLISNINQTVKTKIKEKKETIITDFFEEWKWKSSSQGKNLFSGHSSFKLEDMFILEKLGISRDDILRDGPIDINKERLFMLIETILKQNSEEQLNESKIFIEKFIALLISLKNDQQLFNEALSKLSHTLELYEN